MIEFAAILSALIALLTAIIILSMMYHAIRYVPFVPTKIRIAEKMVELAEIDEGEEVFDLGCGDGRLLHIASDGRKIQAKGIEISRLVSWLARMKTKWKKKNITILRKDFFDVDLRNADVIFCYLFPRVMKKLQKKFEEELKPGARVISYCFTIDEWKASRVSQTRDDKPEGFLIYRYDIPYSYEQ